MGISMVKSLNPQIFLCLFAAAKLAQTNMKIFFGYIAMIRQSIVYLPGFCYKPSPKLFPFPIISALESIL